MKKTLYFHIGHPKCGSSSIQLFCEKNREALLADGFFYPPTSGLTLHAEISPAYFKYARISRNVSANIRKMKAVIEASPANTAILSSESFCQDELEIFDHFSDHDLKFIYYIRRPADYLESILNQSLKNGNIIYEVNRNLFRSADCLGVALKFADHYGRSSVSIGILDEGFLSGGRLVQDFLSRIGHPVRNKYPDNTRSNVSLSGDYLRYAAHLALVPLSQTERATIMAELEQLSSRSRQTQKISLLSRIQRLEIAKRTDANNRRLAHEFLAHYDKDRTLDYFADTTMKTRRRETFAASMKARSKFNMKIKVAQKLSMSTAEQLEIFSKLSQPARSTIILRFMEAPIYDHARQISFPELPALPASLRDYTQLIQSRDRELLRRQVNTLEEKESLQSTPHLVEVYRGHNIVRCFNLLFALPHGIVADWGRPMEVMTSPGVIADCSIDRLKTAIDSVPGSRTDQPAP